MKDFALLLFMTLSGCTLVMDKYAHLVISNNTDRTIFVAKDQGARGNGTNDNTLFYGMHHTTYYKVPAHSNTTTEISSYSWESHVKDSVHLYILDESQYSLREVKVPGLPDNHDEAQYQAQLYSFPSSNPEDELHFLARITLTPSDIKNTLKVNDMEYTLSYPVFP